MRASACFLLVFTGTAALAAPEISYVVSMPRPTTHLLEVEMQVRASGRGRLPNALDLVMPVWTPGSYMIRDYARHVQSFVAVDAAGRPLPWRKVDKTTWRIDARGAPAIRASYRVYANELTVRTNHLDDRHAFWNNTATLMYVDGFLKAPSTVRVVPFADWQVATGLPAVPGSASTFGATNFDQLYDSPFLASRHRTIAFNVRGVPHRIVIDGEGNYDEARLRADVPKVVEAALQTMRSEPPYRDYTFLLMLSPAGGGGLEHMNSTALLQRRFGFRPDTAYRGFLGLVAHEFFHLWNVKRIRPDALGPFDYRKENYTRLLWVAEGLTSYYTPLLLRRAGLRDDRDVLSGFARSMRGLQHTPGRREMSLEAASFDAWIELYRPDENSVNTSVSYYEKGALVGLLLDLEIRRRSAGARSLDDVMRALYTEFALRKRNYTPQDFQRLSERAAGGSLDGFFAKYVRGTAELPYDEALAAVGLRLDRKGGLDKPRANFGATLVQEADRLTVRTVPSDAPAYEAGLSAGDQIVALNGLRVTLEVFNARLEELRPGDVVTLTIFRNDDLRTLPVKLGETAEGEYRIVPTENPTDEQGRLYENWMRLL